MLRTLIVLVCYILQYFKHQIVHYMNTVGYSAFSIGALTMWNLLSETVNTVTVSHFHTLLHI